MQPNTYIETFDDGPGGWFGWTSNSGGPKPLEISDSAVISRSPWWIDYNHAPPGGWALCSGPFLRPLGKRPPIFSFA